MTAERGQWGNQVQFLLTCVGYSVGLGNLWKFPNLAYEHGGVSFLIPYLCLSLLFGLPLLYLELFIGQFTQSGPSKAFRYYMPAMQGIGWCSAIFAFLVGIFYNVIIVYCLIYLVYVIIGQSETWTSCSNEWNTANCTEAMSTSTPSNSSTLPAYEFLKYAIYQTTDSIEHLGGINWPVFGGLIFIWILTALCLMKGVKWIGRISYVTATLPYLIITALFIRGVTLEGASIGLKFYLVNLNWDKLLNFEVWVAAATQMCFSLSVGFGGILSLSSFNDRSHNCFRDALVVVFCDSFMSVFGGCAIFSIMGFLSHRTGRSIDKLFDAKGGVAFVAYPEAIAQMPWSPVWSFLLFFMFFLLGISSQFGTTQTMITALTDQFPALTRHKEVVAISTCILSWMCGLVMCFKGGNHWTDLLADNVGANALLIIVLLEMAIVVHIYGIWNMLRDIRDCLGRPVTILGKIFGSSGYLVGFSWLAVTPLITLILLTMRFISEFTRPAPIVWVRITEICLTYLPLLMIPIFFIVNVIFFYQSKEGITEAFRIQEELPSYKRLRRNIVNNPSQVHIAEAKYDTRITEICLTYLPLLMVPIFFFIVNVIFFYQSKQGITEAFRIQEELPSYKRLRRNIGNHPSKVHIAEAKYDTRVF